MLKNPSNIVLIGMPGSGKSTVGIVLAKLISCNFVDTDVLIQISQGRTLQDIVDTEGYMALREIEERILLKLDCFDHVIATGGSAVYSHAAMTHLKSDGVVVFLNVELPILESRIHDFATRGLAKRPDQSIEDLFEERFVLYTKYADITIECKDLTQEEVCKDIISSIPQGWGSLRRQSKKQSLY
jgi:shikimate kinase